MDVPKTYRFIVADQWGGAVVTGLASAQRGTKEKKGDSHGTQGIGRGGGLLHLHSQW